VHGPDELVHLALVAMVCAGWAAKITTGDNWDRVAMMSWPQCEPVSNSPPSPAYYRGAGFVAADTDVRRADAVGGLANGRPEAQSQRAES
jgi:hypothetical protein